MKIKKGSPGKGASPRPDQFSYTPVAGGLKGTFSGWLAGDPYWCDEAHEHKEYDPGTRPCLHWISDGALSCPRCRKGREVKCIGWVPFYREQDHQPRIVIVHDTVADLLRDLRYPMPILIGRVDGVSSVFVRRNDNGLSFKTENPARKCPVDITRDLLTMWSIPELNEWLRKGSVPTAVKCEKVPDGNSWRLSVPPPTTEVEALAADAHRTAGKDGDGAVDDAMKRALQRAKKAERNGQHKPEEDE